MNPHLLGIDFGLKKVGVAIAIVDLASPYKVIRYNNENSLIKEIKKICEEEDIKKIIVGVSEGEMAIKTQEFVKNLRKVVMVPIETFDETLSTLDAQNMAIEAGIRRSKRKSMEDAMAASVMLQNYLDTLR